MLQPPNPQLRHKVISIYKELFYLGREYPQGAQFFHSRLHRAFMANAHLRDDKAIEEGIRRAEFVKKEVEALYFLKKYRAMNQRYPQGSSGDGGFSEG